MNLDVAAFPHAPDEELAPLLEDLLVRPDFQAAGDRTLVMQSGEDPGFPLKLLGEVIREIKSRTGMAVTVSCGEMAEEDYA